MAAGECGAWSSQLDGACCWSGSSRTLTAFVALSGSCAYFTISAQFPCSPQAHCLFQNFMNIMAASMWKQRRSAMAGMTEGMSNWWARGHKVYRTPPYYKHERTCTANSK